MAFDPDFLTGRRMWRPIRPECLLAAAVLAATVLSAQVPALEDNQAQVLSCTTVSGGDFCEMRESMVDGVGRMDVRGMHNGSLTVRGWSGNQVLVRTRVVVDTGSDSEGQDVADRVRTDVTEGRLRVDGPESSWWFTSPHWQVSAELFVPFDTDVTLSTHNGRIEVSDIDGDVEQSVHNGAVRIERVRGDVEARAHNGRLELTDIGGSVDFGTHNGSVELEQIGGNVDGNTHNGRVQVELAGDRFDGRRVDVRTHNGSVEVAMPAQYSARFRAQTHNGHVTSDFPVTVTGNLSREVREFDVGSGGSPIHVSTHNGSISLRQL